MKRIAPTAKSNIGVLLVAVSAAACAFSPSNARLPPPILLAAALPAYGDVSPAAEPVESVEPVEPEVVTPQLLPSDPPFVDLPVPGHPDAVVGLPDGAVSPRPVLVVIHGLGGKPEPNCNAWRAIVGGWGFVLCPRGEYDAERSTPGDRRYTHPGGALLLAHIEAAIAALAERYAGHVDADLPAIAGFSLGATEVALLGQKNSARFPRLAILEGGLDVWYGAAIESFAANGGVRVLFGCGSAWCPTPANAAAARITSRDGVESRVAFAPVGHTSAPPLQEAIRAELPWFFAGDTRWVVPPR